MINSRCGIWAYPEEEPNMRSACQDLWQRDRSDRRSELNVNVVNRACKQCLLRAKLYIIARVRAKSCSCWKTILVYCSMPVKIWIFFLNSFTWITSQVSLLYCCCQPCEYSNVTVITLLLCIINKEYYSIGPKLCNLKVVIAEVGCQW